MCNSPNVLCVSQHFNKRRACDTEIDSTCHESGALRNSNKLSLSTLTFPLQYDAAITSKPWTWLLRRYALYSQSHYRRPSKFHRNLNYANSGTRTCKSMLMILHDTLTFFVTYPFVSVIDVSREANLLKLKICCIFFERQAHTRLLRFLVLGYIIVNENRWTCFCGA